MQVDPVAQSSFRPLQEWLGERRARAAPDAAREQRAGDERRGKTAREQRAGDERPGKTAREQRAGDERPGKTAQCADIATFSAHLPAI